MILFTKDGKEVTVKNEEVAKFEADGKGAKVELTNGEVLCVYESYSRIRSYLSGVKHKIP